jgi:eukaryotic-like serine/threonine-protein kinase
MQVTINRVSPSRGVPITAASKEKVLDALFDAASKLCGKLGESLDTVQNFELPQETTSSLEALKAYSIGLKAEYEKGPAASLPYYQRAISLDPNFAMGYDGLATSYSNIGEESQAADYFSKAFQLQEHVSEEERLTITADYYLNVRPGSSIRWPAHMRRRLRAIRGKTQHM